MPNRAPRRQAETAASICFVVSGLMLLTVAILAAVGIGIPYWVRMEPRVQGPDGERAIHVGMYDMAFEYRRPFPNCKTNVMVGDLGCYVSPWEITYGAAPKSNMTNIPVKYCWAWCRGTELQVLGTVWASEWLQAVEQAGQIGVVGENGVPFPTSCHNFEPARALIIAALAIAFAGAVFAFISAKVITVGIFTCLLSLASFVLMLIGFIMASVQSNSPCKDVTQLWSSSWGASFILVIIAVIIAFCSTCTLMMGLLSCGLGRLSSRQVADHMHAEPVAIVDHTVRRDGMPHVEAHVITAPQMHEMQHV